MKFKKSYINTLILFFILFSSVLIYMHTIRRANQTIEKELSSLTKVLLNTIQGAVDISIHNYLLSAVEMNRDMVAGFYQRYLDGELSEKEAKEQAKNILLSQTIGETGYFYVIDSRGVVLIHPTSIEDVNMAEQFDFVKQQTILKEGYMEYMWANPKDTHERPKALYMTWFEEWDWIISASSYRDEFVHLVNPDDFKELLLQTKIGETGYPVLLDREGNVLIHPVLEKGVNLKDMQDADGRYFVREILNQRKGKINYMWIDQEGEKAKEKFAYFDYLPELNWMILVSSYSHELVGEKRKLLLYITIQLILIIVLIIIFRKNKIAEALLRKSEKKYRRLAENSPAVVYQFKLSPDGTTSFPFITEHVEKVTGLSAESIMQDANNLIKQVHPEDSERFNQTIMESAEKLTPFSSTHRHIRKDEKVIWIEVLSSPEKMDDGSVVWNGFFIDITARKKAEDALVQLNEKLEQLVSERTNELTATNEELTTSNEEYQSVNEELQQQREELEQAMNDLKQTQAKLIESEKMASLGILTAGVAHEINNPINFISTGTATIQSLLQEKQNIEMAELQPYFDAINTGIKRVIDIVRSLNIYSRSENREYSLCSIHDILNSCLTILHYQYKYRITVEKKYLHEDIKLLGNEGQLHQVFLNLLSNAIQAIPEEGTITIKTRVEKKSISVEIADTGKGIDPGHIKNVFDPFFTTKSPGEGTGLGLSIASRIIKEHKGTIFCQSVLNKGAVFIVTLPLKNNEE